MDEAVQARFWAKVNKNGPIQPHMDTPCWEWIAGPYTYGYGLFWYGEENFGAHKFSWLMHNGATNSLYVCHKCDNKKCVNPTHLFLGTNQENQLDLIEKGRIHNQGADHPQAVLTEEIVRSIRIEAASGTIQRHLAAKYGVTRANISAIVTRRSWPNVK